LSVSPKTQVPGLPKQLEPVSIPQSMSQTSLVESGQIPTPKRKMDDRDTSEPHSAGRTVNGDSHKVEAVESSPLPPPKKRIRYSEPPVWARSVTGRVKPNSALLTGKRINGKAPIKVAPSVSSTSNATPNGHGQTSTAAVRPAPQEARASYDGDGPLGAWEPSITGTKPYEEITKIVADWLFSHVVNRPDAMELASRGVEVEIEAKLGQLINKETNDRIHLPVQTECLLPNDGRVSFKSSMTEVCCRCIYDWIECKADSRFCRLNIRP
jgi:polynucleotide 5'-triphosphatase